MINLVEKEIGERKITIETGKMARQANGSVVLRCGDVVLLATAVMSKHKKEGIDFFPLTVEYAEKTYSAGKIPGGFFKREARPSVAATLTSRLIDRTLRPCFPKDMFNEVQIIVTILSYDLEFNPEALGVMAASAALNVSDIPFSGSVSAVLVGKIDGELKVNPGFAEMEKSSLNLIVAGTKDAILMVEADANELSEDEMIEAISFGHKYIKEMVLIQEELAAKVNKAKIVFEKPEIDENLEAAIKAFIDEPIALNMKSGNKQQISDFLENLTQQVLEKFVEEEKDNEALVKRIYQTLKKEKIREIIITQKIRPDGRSLDEVRPISIELGVLPSTHGAALFTRGETQSLGVVTLGTENDQQTEEGLKATVKKNYYFHYNFPPYSVGETGRMGTGRRELGHGMLAQRALLAVLPEQEKFPYTIRIVSEILESNGSSSMASVCSGSLALMDGGVPISNAVSGIAMGLLLKNDDYIILSDIQGLEDHYGDMDFKVAGTKKGITALQMDIKVGGLSEKILKEAIYQAKQGREFILEKMDSVITGPKDEVASNAPRIEVMKIDEDKIGVVIGPGGKMIRKIESETGASVCISDSEGLVSISSIDKEGLDKAKKMIEMLTKKVKIGDTYDGKVVKIMNFGAFIELIPGKEGLLHISKIADHRVNRVEDELNVGDLLQVKVAEIDAQGRINLARG
jgi:polyribonucleotide nucleotidyltransferase